MDDFRYHAFISYSHADEAWARWLHRAIETYRIPARLRRASGDTLPKRLFPIFRDRDELPSAAELGAVIQKALRDSRALIVVCSPRSAKSRWVNEEIRYFKSLGREAQIFALIVDGKPHSSDAEREAFPAALCISFAGDGAQPAVSTEPIAADVRPRGDGRHEGVLKLVAALLAVPYDDLRQRDRRRRAWQRVQWSVLLLALLAAFLAVFRWQVHERKLALDQQARTTRIAEAYRAGRAALLGHDEIEAARQLEAVYRSGVKTSSLRYLLGVSMRAVDARRLRIETGAPVLWTEFSPDRSRLLSIGSDWHLRIWNAVTGQLQADADLGELSEFGAYFSAGGQWVVVSDHGADNPQTRLRVFRSADGSMQFETVAATAVGDSVIPAIDSTDREFAYLDIERRLVRVRLSDGRVTSSGAGPYSSVGYCRDSRRMVLGTSAGIVLLVDPDRGRPPTRYAGLPSTVTVTDSTRDCGLLAAGTATGSFRVWDTRDGSLRLLGGERGNGLADLRLSTDGDRLFSLSRSSMSLWETASGSLIYSSRLTDPNSNLAAMSADGQRLARIAEGRVMLIDPLSGSPWIGLDGHQAGAQSFAFGGDNLRLVSGGNDGAVVTWDIPSRQIAEWRPSADGSKDGRSAGLAVSLDGRRMLASTPSTPGAHVEIGDGRTALAEVDAGVQPTATALDSQGGRFALGGTGFVDVFDIGKPQKLSLGGFAGRVLLMMFDPLDRWLAAQISGGEARVWDLREGRLLKRFERDEAHAGTFAADGRTYAYGYGGTVVAWDLRAEQPRWTSPLTGADQGVGLVRYSPDGRTLLATLSSRRGWLLDADSGRKIATVDLPGSSYVNAAAFQAGGGRRIAIADSAKVAWLWDPASGVIRTLGGHGAPVKAVEFSPDGALVATGGDDGVVRVWDSDTGDLLDSFPAHDGRIDWEGLAYLQDGSLLSAGSDGRVRRWHMPQERRSTDEIRARLQGLR